MGDQKVSDPLELERVVTHAWALGIEPESSGRAACALTTELSLQLPRSGIQDSCMLLPHVICIPVSFVSGNIRPYIG